MSKERYIVIDGEKIYVTEEVYRAYYRPVWREAKHKEVRADMECSYELLAEIGFEFADETVDVHNIITDKLLMEKLYTILAELSDEEKRLIDFLYYQGKSLRDIESQTGIPRTTLEYRKNQLLKALRKNLKNN